MLFALGHALICVIRGGINDDRPQCRDRGYRAGRSQLALTANGRRSAATRKMSRKQSSVVEHETYVGRRTMMGLPCCDEVIQ
jgi:hypothetical protein